MLNWQRLVSHLLEIPRRLYPLREHPVQRALVESPARFKVVPAGRRSGKTEIAKRTVIAAALAGTDYPDARFFAAAPTRDQAKAIYWADLKAMVNPGMLAEPPREEELKLTFLHGPAIYVVGMDRPERIEGRPWDGGVLDEFANMKPSAWSENVRPALSDRRGWCWHIGVPEGRNHYYDLYKYAASGVDPTWAAFTWFSADILPPDEIAAAKRELDPLVYAQEFEGSFINFEGRAYYAFMESTHCAPLAYDRQAPLVLCFDFNVDPGVCAIIQEQNLPGQYEKDEQGLPLLNRPIYGTGVIGEVHIPRNSNTPAVCRKIIEDWGTHPGSVLAYGDATGGARGTAKVSGSDWDIIRDLLGGHFRDRFSVRIRGSNPKERSRINAVNTRLRSGSGVIRLMVDPAKAPYVVRDFEGVRLLEGGSGEIDKKADLRLTHLTDGIGYYCHEEFPVVSRTVTQSGMYG